MKRLAKTIFALSSCCLLSGIFTSCDKGKEPVDPPVVETVSVTSVEFSSADFTLEINGTKQLAWNVLPSNASNKNVLFASKTPDVASVNLEGLVTGLKAGTAVIEITTVDGGFKDTVNVTVNAPQPTVVNVTSVNITNEEETVDLVKAGTYQIEWEVLPSDASNKNVTFASSSEAVATVDALGKITAVEAGNCTITITTVDGEFTDTIDVVVSLPEPKIYVQSVNPNPAFLKYNTNKGTQTDKTTEFVEMDKILEVGDDNPFRVKPVVVFEDEEGTAVSVTEWTYDIELYEVVEETPTLLTKNGTDFNNYVSAFDDKNCTIDFTENAIGKEFFVKYFPTVKTYDELDPAFKKISPNFKVVDGYNVYDSKELSLLQNYTNDIPGSNGTAWAAWKVENNIDTTLNPAHYLLQADLAVTSSDFPEWYLYMEGDENFPTDATERADVEGSLEDCNSVIRHQVGSDDSFNGNYFTIDFSAIPLIRYMACDPSTKDRVISTAALFTFGQSKAAGNPNTKMTWSNTRFVGNSPKNELYQTSGGIILFRGQGSAFEFDNNLSKCCFMSYMLGYGEGYPFKVKNTKGYDNFNSFFYSCGGKIEIEDSEFMGCGGPAIIQEHLEPEATDSSNKVSETIMTNCNIHSYVSGQEGWFNLVDATLLAGKIKSLSDLFNIGGTTFACAKEGGTDSNTYMDLILLNKAGDSFVGTTKKVKGYVDYNGSIYDYGTFNSASNPIVGTITDTVYSAGSKGAAYQTNSGALGLVNMASIGGQSIPCLFEVDTTNGAQTNITNGTDPVTTALTWDEPVSMALYSNGMMLVLNYYVVSHKI